MARRVGTRIQVFLLPEMAKQVEMVSEHEKISLSKVVGQAMEQHANTDEWQARVAAASARTDHLKALIADLPAEKQVEILRALNC